MLSPCEMGQAGGAFIKINAFKHILHDLNLAGMADSSTMKTTYIMLIYEMAITVYHTIKITIRLILA